MDCSSTWSCSSASGGSPSCSSSSTLGREEDEDASLGKQSACWGELTSTSADSACLSEGSAASPSRCSRCGEEEGGGSSSGPGKRRSRWEEHGGPGRDTSYSSGLGGFLREYASAVCGEGDAGELRCGWPSLRQAGASSGAGAEGRPSAWALLPGDAWAEVGDMLSDRAVTRIALTSRALYKQLTAEEKWASRASRTWALCRHLSSSERGSLAQAFSSEGRLGYLARRSLLLGRKVRVLSGRTDTASIETLAERMGATAVSNGRDADLVLVHLTPHRARGVSSWCWWRTRARTGSRTSSVLMAQWLPASCALGRRLPPHRPGCPSTSSPFSLPRSCIAPCRVVEGSELCCYAPRLLEGLLVSASRVPNREAVAAIVRALGGEYTEELTREHTHLIAEDTQGLKFEFAHAHRIPVVSRAWLEMTHRLGLPMQERCFAVGRRA